jgi:bifunctional ADP-heptose synthase (sugar kinase/adenylyltransferase)
MIHTKRLADRLQRTRVLVVGDLMLDCYYWGEVRRISPEAPVPVVKVNEKSYQLGGAGNVVANLAGLGCSSTLVGLIGKDPAADRIKAMVASISVEDHTCCRCREADHHQDKNHGR